MRISSLRAFLKTLSLLYRNTAFDLTKMPPKKTTGNSGRDRPYSPPPSGSASQNGCEYLGLVENRATWRNVCVVIVSVL